MDINRKLLAAVRSRGEKRTAFNYGILTADAYVRGLRDYIGSDACYRYAARGNISFQDILQKASQTLVYANPEMELEEIEWRSDGNRANLRRLDPEGPELPKNTLMVFRHVLTTPKKDRDGDILRTEGAEIDPKMLLLFNHVPTLPIGKMLAVVEHNEKRLVLTSVIIDMNELAHDSAVMIDNGMGRFSHGFRAKKFKELKGSDDEPPGFDVTHFEIMEESLVSVPSNTDAEVDEVLLSLVDRKKLTSPIMKAMGRHIRDRRDVAMGMCYRERVGDYEKEIRTATRADFEAVFNMTKGGNHENQSRDRSNAGAEQFEPEGTPCTSEETKEVAQEAIKAGDTEMNCEVVTLVTPVTPVTDGKPYTSEHACRLKEPSEFQPGSFRRSSRTHEGKEYAVIMGRLKGEETMTDQAYRYPSDSWSADQARDHCTGHGGRMFEPATIRDVEFSIKDASLHEAGRRHAASLVAAGKVKRSRNWNPPSAAEENAYIEKNGMAAFGRWHLGIKLSKDEHRKGDFAYPFTSDFKNVDRAGIVAIRQRAGQQHDDAIFQAAGVLLERIDRADSEERQAQVDSAIKTILEEGSSEERNRLLKILEAMRAVEEEDRKAEEYRRFAGQ